MMSGGSWPTGSKAGEPRCRKRWPSPNREGHRIGKGRYADFWTPKAPYSFGTCPFNSWILVLLG